VTSQGPGAEPWVRGSGGLSALREALTRCRGCDLWEDATQPVPGEGAADAAMVLVGEQPGDREDLAGEPFVGPAGHLLDRALDEAGIAREVVYRTNAVKHFRFTTRGKRRIHESPARWQVAACGPWLLAELERVAPRVVVLLGATAGQAVHGPSLRVGRVRGTVMSWPGDRLPLAEPPEAVVTTVHPSSVLRSRTREEDFAAFVADLEVAAAAL
jgi:DNA polymerase